MDCEPPSPAGAGPAEALVHSALAPPPAADADEPMPPGEPCDPKVDAQDEDAVGLDGCASAAAEAQEAEVLAIVARAVAALGPRDLLGEPRTEDEVDTVRDGLLILLDFSGGGAPGGSDDAYEVKDVAATIRFLTDRGWTLHAEIAAIVKVAKRLLLRRLRRSG